MKLQIVVLFLSIALTCVIASPLSRQRRQSEYYQYESIFDFSDPQVASENSEQQVQEALPVENVESVSEIPQPVSVDPLPTEAVEAVSQDQAVVPPVEGVTVVPVEGVPVEAVSVEAQQVPEQVESVQAEPAQDESLSLDSASVEPASVEVSPDQTQPIDLSEVQPVQEAVPVETYPEDNPTVETIAVEIVPIEIVQPESSPEVLPAIEEQVFSLDGNLDNQINSELEDASIDLSSQEQYYQVPSEPQTEQAVLEQQAEPALPTDESDETESSGWWFW